MTILPYALAILLSGPFVAGCVAHLTVHVTKREGPYGLLFHSIVSDCPKSISQISKTTFGLFLDSMTTTFSAQTVRQTSCPEFRVGKKGKTPVTITFDDGFLNFYTTALPQLEEHGMKSTIFPVVEFLGKKSDWDIYNEQHLDRQHLRDIADLGHEIGSHTMTHPDLCRLPSKDLHWELYTSRCKLEDMLGIPVTTISFPYGCWNERVWAHAQKCGYTSATAYRGFGNIRNNNILPVLGVYSFDRPENMHTKATTNSGSLSYTIASLMSHFSKGAPLWKYRENYRLFPK